MILSQEMVDLTQSNSQVKRFKFKDSEGTRIIFFPQAQPNDPPGASQLEYQGPEGQLVFRGDDILKEASQLGRLVTVTLQSNAADAELITLTVVFPPLVFGNQKQLKYKTIAVKSRGFGFGPANQSGASLTYEVLNLESIADLH